MKNNIITFYSDLKGTYLDKIDDLREERIKKLFDTIERLRVTSDCSEVKFYILTDYKYCDELIQSLNELKEHISGYEYLTFEKCFYENGVIKDNFVTPTKINFKVAKLIDETNYLSQYYDVKKVIYADDSPINLKLSTAFLQKTDFNYDIELILAQNGLNTVIEEIQRIISTQIINVSKSTKGF